MKEQGLLCGMLLVVSCVARPPQRHAEASAAVPALMSNCAMTCSGGWVRAAYYIVCGALRSDLGRAVVLGSMLHSTLYNLYHQGHRQHVAPMCILLITLAGPMALMLWLDWVT
jgi:hypothetical protein